MNFHSRLRAIKQNMMETAGAGREGKSIVINGEPTIVPMPKEHGFRTAKINGVHCFRACEIVRVSLDAKLHGLGSSLSNLFAKKYPTRCFVLKATSDGPGGWWIDTLLDKEYISHIHNAEAQGTASGMFWGGMANAKMRAFDKKAAEVAIASLEPELPLGVAPLYAGASVITPVERDLMSAEVDVILAELDSAHPIVAPPIKKKIGRPIGSKDKKIRKAKAHTTPGKLKLGIEIRPETRAYIEMISDSEDISMGAVVERCVAAYVRAKMRAAT